MLLPERGSEQDDDSSWGEFLPGQRYFQNATPTSPLAVLFFFFFLLLPYLCLCVKCDTVNMLTDDNTLLINSFSLAKGRDNLGAFVANCSLYVSVLQLGDQEQHHSALQPVALSETAKHEWFNKEEV